MPFRKNFFGEKIAQPGTDWSEIDNMLLNELDLGAGDPVSAELFTLDNDDGENLFGFGGTILVSGNDLDSYDDDAAGTTEVSINFDGFETMDDARAWLIGLGLKDYNIEEIA